MFVRGHYIQRIAYNSLRLALSRFSSAGVNSIFAFAGYPHRFRIAAIRRSASPRCSLMRATMSGWLKSSTFRANSWATR